ncbi:MAG: 16S rRNA processing protein RimM [Dehalococcoidales bacterium]|nr:16S rRNA processing protein RimM [Dehalococcoidales bacterium]
MKNILRKMKHIRHIPLPEGQFYHDQIIGLQVETTGGEYIGYVTDILTGVSNDNFIVKSESGEILIPVIEDVIQSIDLATRTIIIEPMEGLLDLNMKKPPK